MGTDASQITSFTIVYSTVYSGADQRKHQCSVSLAFVLGIHRRPVNSPHKWPVTRKMFPFDDVIMNVLIFCWFRVNPMRECQLWSVSLLIVQTVFWTRVTSDIISSGASKPILANLFVSRQLVAVLSKNLWIMLWIVKVMVHSFTISIRGWYVQ